MRPFPLVLAMLVAPQGVAIASARNGIMFADFLVPMRSRVPLDAAATTPEAGT